MTVERQAPDPTIATRAREGDITAFAALYEEYARPIHDFLLRTVRNRAAAEDLTQSTFVKAFERRATLRDPQRVRSWLFTIAHNLAMDAVSRTKPAADIEDQPDLATTERGPEAEALATASAELVWAAASSLEPRQYAVLDLTVRQGLTTPEVALALDVDAGHAAVLVNRAREALGNAFRYLLVARRRSHCTALAALVPAGVTGLTPEQRTSVDHHMRRCESCTVMGRALTTPAEILGGIAVLSLPAALAGHGQRQLVHTLTDSLTAAHLPVTGTARVMATSGGGMLRTVLIGVVAGAVSAATVGGAIVLSQRPVAVTPAGAGAPTAASTSAPATPTPSTPLTPTPSTPVTPTPSPLACTVVMSLGPSNSYAGHSVEEVILTNSGAASCVLDGYPAVALQGPGGEVGSVTEVQGGGQAATATPTAVSLAPGARANFTVEFSDVPSGSATCPTVTSLTIRLPGGGPAAAQPLAYASPVCPPTFNVGAVVSGT